MQVRISLFRALLKIAVAYVVLRLCDQVHLFGVGRNFLVQIHCLGQIIQPVVAVGLVELRLGRLRHVNEGLVVPVDGLIEIAVAVKPVAAPSQCSSGFGKDNLRHEYRNYQYQT